jgi:hypothetical protein
VVEQHRANGLADGLLRGLIVEHLVPATLTVSEAVRRAPSMTADELVSLLRWHGAAAVVTIADDKRLSSAGLASRMPDGWTGDVWARPRAAGLDPRSFIPISQAASMP